MPPVDLTGSSGVSLDSLTIGNALVDVLATVDEGFLIREKIVKGSMNLVDIARSKHLHSLVNSRTEMSGGSAANTAYGLASLGGKAGFIGKISADRLGAVLSWCHLRDRRHREMPNRRDTRRQSYDEYFSWRSVAA